MRALVVALVLAGCSARRTSPTTPPTTTPPVPAHAAAPSRESGPPHSASTVTPILLRNARLIDGTGAAPKDNIDVLLEHGVITQIGADLPPTSGAVEVDLGGRTLLPGFIDAHVHLTFSPPANFAKGVVRDLAWHDADRALQGVDNAWRTLAAGFTTVRNVGGSFADRALRDAIARGSIPGPRMLVANHAITITGGHCDDSNGFRPEVLPAHAQDYRSGVADGVQEVRKAVRFQVKHGADVIKVCATGGVLSQGDAVGAPQMNAAELAAAVDEAHRADRRVAAHAHGNLGIREAVQAGVDSVEHGSVLDPETIAMMRARGTFLVPTLSAGEYVVAAADSGTLSQESAAKAREIAPKMRTSFAMAYKAGVSIALGSDAGVFDHGLNGREFRLMVAEGMAPMDAIIAGTSAAAHLLGVDDIGVIKVGARADLVVIDGDPLTTITLLEQPAMVLKGGAVYVPATWTRTAATP